LAAGQTGQIIEEYVQREQELLAKAIASILVEC
jgi:hypothetical protein